MDEIRKDLTTIRESQIRMEGDLKHHIKRTEILEKAIIPIKKTHDGIKFVGKLLGAAILVFSFIFSAKKAFPNTQLIRNVQSPKYIKNYKPVPIFKTLRKIRKKTRCPIIMHSYWRSPKHNRRVGGVKNSYHLKGRAMDISSACVSNKKLAKIAHRYATVIIYPTHIHIDNRRFKKCLVKRNRGFRKCRKGDLK